MKQCWSRIRIRRDEAIVKVEGLCAGNIEHCYFKRSKERNIYAQGCSESFFSAWVTSMTLHMLKNITINARIGTEVHLSSVYHDFSMNWWNGWWLEQVRTLVFLWCQELLGMHKYPAGLARRWHDYRKMSAAVWWSLVNGEESSLIFPPPFLLTTLIFSLLDSVQLAELIYFYILLYELILV